MFLHDLTKGLMRRWYFFILGLALTLCAGLYVYQEVPPTYQATASVVLVPPATAVVEGENPYLYMGGLDQAMSVLMVKMNSAVVSQPILKDKAGLGYSVDRDISTTGPIMVVTADGDTEAETLRVLRNVITVMPQNLKTLQDQLSIPSNARITSMSIVTDEKAKSLNKNQIRMVLAAMAGGMAGTVLLTALLDRLMVARRQRKAVKNAPGVGKPSSSGRPANETLGKPLRSVPSRKTSREERASASAVHDGRTSEDTTRAMAHKG